MFYKRILVVGQEVEIGWFCPSPRFLRDIPVTFSEIQWFSRDPAPHPYIPMQGSKVHWMFNVKVKVNMKTWKPVKGNMKFNKQKKGVNF